MHQRSFGWAAFPVLLAALLVPSFARAQEEDFGWPRQIVLSEGTITIYQPQPEDLKGNILTGRAATSFQKTGNSDPVFGVFWFEGRLDVDRDARTAVVSDVKIPRVRFPEATREQELVYIGVVEHVLPKWKQPISLDRLIASLAAVKEEKKSAVGLKNDPPKILLAESPSLLIVYDGEPALRNIPDSKLKRVVNTPFPVIYDPAAKAYFLTNTTYWFSSPDPMGPWKAGATPPPEVAAVIPKNAKVEAAQDRDPAKGDQPPQIVTSREPAELIWTKGPPDLRPVTGVGDLLYVRNTESNILYDVKSKAFYMLLSGRWFTSGSLSGPWVFVKPSNLPSSFNTIPPKFEKASVRASVPGTDEAMDAIMDTQIPQTAAIKRGVAHDVRVTYDGPPQFRPVEGTNLMYAVNSGQQVLRSGDRYFLCLEGVWYISGVPEGPWAVSDVRPAGVEEIPPSNPLYNTQYVMVYAATDEVVYAGYTEGYEGAYSYDDTVVYGTGWTYPGWVGDDYYPSYWTWGWGAYYDPWYGWGYRGGFGWGFGWGFAWGAALSHWGWGGGCWHGGGYYGGNIGIGNIHIGDGNRPGRGQGARQREGVGNRPGNAQGAWPGPQAPNRNRYTRGENANRLAPPAQSAKARQEIARAPKASRGANNVYASPDGGVYRQRDNGSWQQRGENRWTDADLPSAATRETSGFSDGRGAQVSRPSSAPGVQDFGNLNNSANLGGAANRGSGGGRADGLSRDASDRRSGGGRADGLNRDAAARQRGASQTRDFNRKSSGGGRGGSSGGRGGGGRGGGGRR
jgi:hypothetical protein